VGRDRLVPRLLSPAWRSRVTAEQNWKGWETVVRIDKSLWTVLHEARRQQVEDAMDDSLSAVRVCTNTLTDFDDANLLPAPRGTRRISRVKECCRACSGRRGDSVELSDGF
jgi:hypothetical protein